MTGTDEVGWGEGRDVDDGGDGEVTGNRLVGAVPRSVLEFVARSIVDDPDAVDIQSAEGRRGVDLRLTVAPADMGKIIGRRGRVAQAIRTLVRAAGAREGIEASVEIVD
ncbi:MAG: KH domain-containing protein [Acidimicrobiales bacterium]